MEKKHFLNSWTVETDRNRIISPDGKEHKIEPKIMQVLICLIEVEGEPVTKDYLMKKVWEETIVTEYSLSRAISHLRKVFNDDPVDPSFIETIPKTGYRLIPEIHQNPPEKKFSRKEHQISFLLYFIGFLSIITLSLLYLYFSPFTSPQPLSWINSAQITPFTTSRGIEIHPDISVHNQTIVFAHQTPGQEQFDLFAQSIDSNMPVKITDTEQSETMPKYSPDGTEIIYIVNESTINKMPSSGGSSVILFEAPSDAQISHIDWSPDGDQIALSMSVSGNSYSIYLLDLNSFEAIPLTHPEDSDFGDQQPVFSPEGDHIAFGRMTTPGVRDIWVYDINQDNPIRVTYDNVQIHGIEWIDTSQLLFVSNRSGIFNLWTVNQLSSQIVPLSTNLIDLENPILSTDNFYLSFEQWDNEINIYKYSLTNNNLLLNSDITIQSNRLDWSPAVSPDGNKIAFSSDRSGTSEIWISNTDGTSQRRLTSLSTPYTIAPAWSPDGNRITFESRMSGNSSIYLVDIRGGEPQYLTGETFDTYKPFFLNDPVWVYYSSKVNGSSNIWRVHLETLEKEQVTKNGASFARPESGGSSFFFTKPDQTGIWKYSTEDQQENKFLDAKIISDWSNWNVTPEGIYFLELNTEEESNGHALNFYDFEDETIKNLGEIQNIYKNSGLGVNVLSNELFISIIEGRESDIMLIKNTSGNS